MLLLLLLLLTIFVGAASANVAFIATKYDLIRKHSINLAVSRLTLAAPTPNEYFIARRTLEHQQQNALQ